MVDANADVEAGCAGATSQTDRRFIIAIDYGTTNSSASYAIVSNDTQDLSRGNVRTISNFPAGPFRDPRRRLDQQILSDEVPSEVWYPEEEIKHQLGLDDFVIGEEDAQELEVGEQEQESDSLNGQATGQNKRKAKTYWRTHPANVRWGFEARPSHALSAASDFLNHRNSTVKWAKLQLADPDAYQKKGYPPQTRKAFNTLRYHGIVRKELDFITDFLTCFLKHIKQELQMAHGLREDESVEMVLCVPVCWSCKARRDMQAATIVAMKNAGLGTSESLYNMFMVTEPEAAAAYVLDDKYDLIKVRCPDNSHHCQRS